MPTATPSPLCGALPRSDCRAAAKASIVVKDPTKSSGRRLGWRWLRGASTPLEAWGDPRTDTTYALCIYDETGETPHLAAALVVPAGGVCANRPCWRLQGGRVFKYGDKTGAAGGIQRITLKSGETSRAAITIGAAGTNLVLPAAATAERFFDQDTRLTVQLVNDALSGQCWSADYDAPARTDTATAFGDKVP